MGNSDVEEDQRTELWIDIRRIGVGAFGSVWMQGETQSGRMRAVKKILWERTAGQSLSRELRSLVMVRDVSIELA